MKKFFTPCVLSLLLATALPPTATSLARNHRDRPQQPRIVLHTSLTIVPDSKAYEARLQISQSSLQELRAALANTPENESMTQRLASSSTRTMLRLVYVSIAVGAASGSHARCRREAKRPSLFY